MGELLKAVLTEQSISQNPVCYMAETGILPAAQITGVLQELVVTIQDQTVFLCQGISVSIATQLGNNALRAHASIGYDMKVSFSNPITSRQYFSSSVTGYPTNNGIQAVCFPPTLNDQYDQNEYIMCGPLDKIQANISGQIGNAPYINIGVMYSGVEYKFSSSPNLAALKTLGLQYVPPQRDPSRAMSINPLGAVTGRAGPVPKAKNIPSAQGMLAGLQAELEKTAKVPQTAQVGAYRRYLTHQITQIKNSIQNANSTK